MALKNKKDGAGASWAWAVATPFILVAAACTVVGIFFLPALCVWLDGRSRTNTGSVILIAATAVLTYLFGAPALAISACVVIAAASAIVLRRMKQPFPTGLAASSAGGVLGMVALLGILGGSLGVPLNEAAASSVTNQFAAFANSGYPYPLDLYTNILRLQGQTDMFSMLSGAGGAIPADILSMSVADKVAAITPSLETMFAVTIPSVALAGGMLLGALTYWLPSLALALQAKRIGETPDVAVPPFASFKVPKYVVISLLLVQIAATFAASSEGTGWLTMQLSAEWALGLMMAAQAISLISFFLNRKRVAMGLQVLIFIPAVLLFSWLLYWVGIFDALFDLRTVLPRVEEVRAKGKQVFTQDGLEELRKMQQSKRGKKDDDGEDGKK